MSIFLLQSIFATGDTAFCQECINDESFAENMYNYCYQVQLLSSVIFVTGDTAFCITDESALKRKMYIVIKYSCRLKNLL